MLSRFSGMRTQTCLQNGRECSNNNLGAAASSFNINNLISRQQFIRCIIERSRITLYVTSVEKYQLLS